MQSLDSQALPVVHLGISLPSLFAGRAQDGRTPLYWAACHGPMDMVKALLAAGAQVHKATKVGFLLFCSVPWQMHCFCLRTIKSLAS